MPATVQLTTARRKLWEFLAPFEQQYPYYTQYDWIALRAATDTWYFAYKSWERQDTFDAAFREGRMTARGIRNAHETNVVYDLMVHNDAYERTGEFKLWVHFDGIQRRLNPNAFLDGGKYTEGLHALPAVLLDPDHAIQPQLFGSRAHLLFMPLPEEEDIQVQAYLSAAAKRLNIGDVSQRIVLDSIRRVRRTMTRIHLASNLDMGTSYWNLGDDDNPKLKYGWSDSPDGYGNKKSDEIIGQFRHNALNYQLRDIRSMADRDKNNEVTVKYRRHAGNYPLFTRRVTTGRGGSTIYFQEEDNLFHPVNHHRRVTNQGRLQHKTWFAGIIPAWKSFPSG